MPREEAQAPDHNQTMLHVLNVFQISDYSEAQLSAFVDSITGRSRPQFRRFLLYVLQFVEYNRSWYLQIKHDLNQVKEELSSLKNDLTVSIASGAIGARVAAPQPAIFPPLASQAMAPPLASQAMAPPLASQATAPALAPQAMVPPLAPQAMAPGHVVGTTTYSPPVLNANGTISRRMDQVGNNVMVTFSGDEDMASKKSKLFGSSAKLDTFTGYDMNQFPEWVVQFLCRCQFIPIHGA